MDAVVAGTAGTPGVVAGVVADVGGVGDGCGPAVYDTSLATPAGSWLTTADQKTPADGTLIQSPDDPTFGTYIVENGALQPAPDDADPNLIVQVPYSLIQNLPTA